VDAVFNGIDTLPAMEKTKEAGYSAYEFWSWWDKNLSAIRAKQEKLGLTLSAFCTKMISLTEPYRRGAYLAGLKESISTANELNCRVLISQVGNDTGAERKSQRASVVAGLKESANLLEESGITLVIEPLNTKIDHQGYYLYSSQEAFDIVHEVDSPNVKVLFDIYHQQIMEGDLLRHMDNWKGIGHFHAAGNPGRHELYYGEIQYAYLFSEIYKSDYRGFVGLEYFPKDDVSKGLAYCQSIADEAFDPHLYL
jgi:hydroxypyruvate isomerase